MGGLTGDEGEALESEEQKADIWPEGTLSGQRRLWRGRRGQRLRRHSRSVEEKIRLAL